MQKVSISEAAKALGVSPDTVRRRIAAKELAAEKRRTKHGNQWFVELPDDVQYVVTVGDIDIDKVEAENDRLRSRLEYLEARLADLLEEVADLRAQRDAWQAMVQANDEERRELRLLLAQAIESRPALPANVEASRSSWWKRG